MAVSDGCRYVTTIFKDDADVSDCSRRGSTVTCGILAFIVAEAIPFFGLLLGLIGKRLPFTVP